jgi:hypothetical protein
MSMVQIHPANRFEQAKNLRIDRAQAFARLAALLVAVLFNRWRVDDYIVSQFGGRAWCDSTEYELNNDIVTCHRF